MRVLVVGGGAREHAIAYALAQSEAEVVVAAPHQNPGLVRIAKAFLRVDPTQPEPIVRFAKEQHVDFAVIGRHAVEGGSVG